MKTNRKNGKKSMKNTKNLTHKKPILCYQTTAGVIPAETIMLFEHCERKFNNAMMAGGGSFTDAFFDDFLSMDEITFKNKYGATQMDLSNAALNNFCENNIDHENTNHSFETKQSNTYTTTNTN